MPALHFVRKCLAWLVWQPWHPALLPALAAHLARPSTNANPHTHHPIDPCPGPQGATVHLDRVERFITEVGKAEDAIFARRMRMLQRQKVSGAALAVGRGGGAR